MMTFFSVALSTVVSVLNPESKDFPHILRINGTYGDFCFSTQP